MSLGALSVVAGFLVAGCSARNGGRDALGQSTDLTPPKPIPECQQYEQSLAACTGRRIPVADETAALATSDDERNQMKSLCVLNMQRLRASCLQ